MTAAADRSESALLQLMGWTADGKMVFHAPCNKRTLAISGFPGADYCLPQLGKSTVFIKVNADGGTVLFQRQGGDDQKVIVRVGQPEKVGPITWLLTAENRDRDQASNAQLNVIKKQLRPVFTLNDPIQYFGILNELIPWIRKPMRDTQEVRESLNDFLALIIKSTPATNGMLVLAQANEFSLVASHGLSPSEAQTLWEKMPHSLGEEIIRSGAKVLLPAELRLHSQMESTVYVKDVQSVAGFPVMAEGQLIAIIYLGFDNLIDTFSEDLQKVGEAVSDVLGIVIQRVMLREQVENLRLSAAAGATESAAPGGRLMVGNSRALMEVYKLIQRLAPVDVATLISGETGTGKELAAKEMHRLSSRAKQPFIVVNAAALPEALIESELFGHKRGAFTGALSDRKGLVEQANTGTLFIDEIGELSAAIQTKLLRVLQEHAVTRIGETHPRDVNFRLITATHRDLQEMMKSGRFREDLYYRIAGAVIHMPPLRERADDIIPLANYFRRRFSEKHGLGDKEWSANALIGLEAYSWPGNIRELENVVARAFVMAEDSIITSRDLGDLGVHVSSDSFHRIPHAEGHPLKLADAREAWMRDFIGSALRKHQGRRWETAKALGIGERTLFRYIEKLKISE